MSRGDPGVCDVNRIYSDIESGYRGRAGCVFRGRKIQTLISGQKWPNHITAINFHAEPMTQTNTENQCKRSGY